MKLCRLMVLLCLLVAVGLPAEAAEKRSESWDNLIEYAYKFTWYPRQDIQDLLRAKSNEYGQSLEEYQGLLLAELSGRAAVEKTIDPEQFVAPKPWKLYYRLAIAQFCSFLVRDDVVYLENAIAVISVISGKREMVNVSFWYYLLQAYADLRKKDRDAFVNSVFRLWNDAVILAEINQTLTRSKPFQPDSTALQHYYENTAHLILTRAIVEDQMPELHPLSAIVISLNDKLVLENGYKQFVEAVSERLSGLKSDNNNLNFAVAFVEATANQYEFEDEASAQQIVAKYTAVRLTYDLALTWANTLKGKAAISTQYMGFNNYIVRRLVAKDALLASDGIFLDVPKQAARLADLSMGLYHDLAKSAHRENRFLRDGFYKRSNYIEAMHQLWDSIAKLLMTLASYHQANNQSINAGQVGTAEVFLLKYLTLFEQYCRQDADIVPNNAFYMAAYAASQLSALYSQAKPYSKIMLHNNLAFTYQLQAVELFPLDMVGILKLAYQTDQENRPRIYFKYVAPLATRLRDSSVAWSWMDKNLPVHGNAVEISLNVVPGIVEDAFIYLDVLQQTKGPQTEADIYNKLRIMNGLYSALKMQGLEGQIPTALAAVAGRDFADENMSLNAAFKAALAPEIRATVAPPPELKIKFSIQRLKNELYAAPDSQLHAFLRELYFEDTAKIHRQLLQHK